MPLILRELFATLGLKVNEASFAKGQLAADLVKVSLSKLVDVGLAAVHSFVDNAKAALEYGDKVNKTSQSIGIAVEALQELQYAGSMAGLSSEEMSQSIGLLSRKMLEAKNGGQEAAKAFSGIAFQRDGKLLGADEVLGSIADKFAKMPDGAEKTALAMQLFGRSGKQMIPLLNQGSGELEKMRKEAQELGLVMSGENAKASEELNDNLERLHSVTQGLWRGAISPLIPAINQLVVRFLEWKKANGALISQKIQSFMGAMIKGVELLGDGMGFLIRLVNAGMIPVFNALSVAAVAAGSATMWAWIKAAAPFAAIAAVVAGFMLLLDDIRGYHEGEDSLFGTFKDEINDWMNPGSNKDPWFLRVIVDFVVWLEKAIVLLGKITNFLSGDNELRRQINSLPEDKNPFDLIPKGKSLFDKSTGGVVGAPGGQGPAEPGPGAVFTAPFGQATPEYRAPSSGGGSVSVSAPATFTITQQPGQSGQALIDMMKEQISNFWQTNVEAAAAGVKP